VTDALARELQRLGVADAARALLAVDPEGLGGVVMLRPSHAAAARWTQALRTLMGGEVPLRRLPIHATDDRVLGGLDLSATLATGRRVVMRGVLAEAHGGILVIPLAERAPAATIAAIAGALDEGEVVVERDGVAARHEARAAVVAIDDTAEAFGDLQVVVTLSDRLAFQLILPEGDDAAMAWPSIETVQEARMLLSSVECTWAARELTALATALGVASLRATLMAVRAARANAALDGRLVADGADVEVAVRLVLAPRATQLPASAEDEAPQPEASSANADSAEPRDEASSENLPAGEVLLSAIRAMLPPDLLDDANRANTRRARTAGRRGRETQGGDRGRQVRAVRGTPGGGRRLDPIATLRAAAPWQALRRAETQQQGERGDRVRAFDVRADDFRVRRFKRKTGTTTIVAVDASGSMAFQRLAEAKGAVELLLGQTYVRRDKVALVAFRGGSATLLLPPTRALARAKRLVAALPGGGGTPIASAIDMVHALSLGAVRDGQDVVGVWLTDGRANVARDGSPGRARALEDALHAARAFRALGQTAVLIDTSARGDPAARALGQELGARYVPLPAAQARELAQCVRRASEAPTP